MSTKGRFAVDAMIDLALRESAGPVALVTISQRQGVSLSYLEQLFAGLRQQGLVASVRGPGGGYKLGRPAAQISVADIVGAVEPPPPAPQPGEAGAGSGSLWVRLDQALLAHMAGISLHSLVDEQRGRGVSVEPAPKRRAIAAEPVVKPVRTKAPNSVFAFGRSFAD
jgi:Rrf2 family iron-sulfur cluster assembly transcriptional regulator